MNDLADPYQRKRSPHSVYGKKLIRRFRRRYAVGVFALRRLERDRYHAAVNNDVCAEFRLADVILKRRFEEFERLRRIRTAVAQIKRSRECALPYSP